MTAPIEESIPLLYYTGSLRIEGAPTRRFYAWGVGIMPSRSIRSADKYWERRVQRPRTQTQREGTQFIPSLGVRATRRPPSPNPRLFGRRQENSNSCPECYVMTGPKTGGR